MSCLPIILAVTLAQAASPPTPVAAPVPATYRELVVTYSDAQTTVLILKPRGGFWTPKFPRQSVPKTYEDLPLTALQLDYIVEKDAVAATVSLKYGSPQQRTVPVASARLTDNQPVEVPQLLEFGVSPITLLVREASPALLVQPAVSTVSSAIDVRIALPSADIPLYAVTMTNRGTRSARVLQYKGYRGDIEVVSGRRGGDRSLPAIEPDGRTEFTMSLARADGPQGIDRFAVTSVLWDDWSIEGDESLKTSVVMLGIGAGQQLRRVIALLQDQSVDSIAELRRRVEALPIDGQNSTEMIGQRQVRDAVLADLKSASPPSWRQNGIASYNEWLSRVTPR